MYFGVARTEVPEPLLGICKALGHKVDRLVRLVLVWLHCRRVGIELSHLRLVGQRVLDSDGGKVGELAVLCRRLSCEQRRRDVPRALHTKKAARRRRPSSRRSACTSHTPR